MSHCYSVGVNINGEEKEVCTVVPGNEDLAKDVEAGKQPKVTKEHIDRAIKYYLEHTHEEDEKVSSNPSQSHKRGILHK